MGVEREKAVMAWTLQGPTGAHLSFTDSRDNFGDLEYNLVPFPIELSTMAYDSGS